MIIFKYPADLQHHFTKNKIPQALTGFVPTMGALHNGHIALVNHARRQNRFVVCSIFVNPTQFNDPKDFEKYPSAIDKDIYLLEKAGCDILILPKVTDMYPGGIKPTRHYELGFLETVLEGKFRPGHFQGVCQVVHRLLNIVMPSYLYLGQKDLQQCLVLKKMIGLTGLQTQTIICPTLREPDGLAMSSRNMRLSEPERLQAPAIYKALTLIKENIGTGDIAQLKEAAAQSLMLTGFKVDYIEVAEAETLKPVKTWDGKTTVAILAAAYLNKIRLIDNVTLNSG